MQNSIYKIKYLLFLSWDREAWCLTQSAWNKGRKYFHCLGAPNNLIRPCIKCVKVRHKNGMVLKDAMLLVWYMSTNKNTADSIFGWQKAGTELLGGKTQTAEILATPRETQISSTSVLSLCKQALLFLCCYFSCWFLVKETQLTPWCRVLLQRLTCSQTIKTVPAFHGASRFMSVFTTARHWIQPTHSILFLEGTFLLLFVYV